MKLLISGGFGYLGGRLAQFLASQSGDDIVLGSRRQTESPEWLPQVRVVRTQWDSPARLEEICSGITSVVHLAGMNAQDCAADPVTALEVNAVATARFLRAAIRKRVKRFIYLSTAHVYGSPLTGLITEDVCPASVHPYATSHRAGEDVVRAAHHRGDIEGIVIRLSNAYGAPTHKDVNCWVLLVNDLCRQAVTAGRMVLHSSGMQRRDFVPMVDACRAIRHFLELSSDKLGDGLFNVGGGWAPTILEMTHRVAERIQIETGKKMEIFRQEDPNDKDSEFFSFGMKKLTDTGFRVGDSANVDQEIVGLIHFCLRHIRSLV